MQFNLDYKILVKTNLSRYMVSSLLQQYNNNSFLYLYAFFSWKNRPAECNYKIYNKELLAIVKYLKEWSSELYSIKKFKILTNYKNLEYFTITYKLTEHQIR